MYSVLFNSDNQMGLREQIAHILTLMFRRVSTKLRDFSDAFPGHLQILVLSERIKDLINQIELPITNYVGRSDIITRKWFLIHTKFILNHLLNGIEVTNNVCFIVHGSQIVAFRYKTKGNRFVGGFIQFYPEVAFIYTNIPFTTNTCFLTQLPTNGY